MTPPFLQTLTLANFLSYGSTSHTIELQALNVIIGPNGSGKSNLVEALELLRATPKDLLTPIREGGGVRNWLWKGVEKHPPDAKIQVLVSYAETFMPLHYQLCFSEVGQRFYIIHEEAGHERNNGQYYEYRNGHYRLAVQGEDRFIPRDEIDPTASILAQLKDPVQYRELTYLGNSFSKIRLYREWCFGRNTVLRQPQRADSPNEHLEPDGSNLGLVLNRLRREPLVKKQLLKALQALYAHIDDFDVQIEGGTVQVFFSEGNYTIPATRLSDGTLRYLCLLAVLCHPQPGPLICIEEPELGLHPDVLPTLADLIKAAAERTQVIITTHSDVLVDAFTDTPEAVLVAERGENGTTLERLNRETLKPWLENYRLGQLWTRGDLGGTRW